MGDRVCVKLREFAISPCRCCSFTAHEGEGDFLGIRGELVRVEAEVGSDGCEESRAFTSNSGKVFGKRELCSSSSSLIVVRGCLRHFYVWCFCGGGGDNWGRDYWGFYLE